VDKYPHELSGGMARRVLLCCALMDNPRVIIADEPTPGLDLELAQRALADLREFADDGGGVLLITHDIELALRVADRVAVFNEGTVVEETAVANFASPSTLAHPFSRALWHALPEHDFCLPEEQDPC
jgi:ABC-type dipeptide/oligopeptide/nickel transport system ATPase component